MWLGSVKYGYLWFSFSVGEEEGIADDVRELGSWSCNCSTVCLSLLICLCSLYTLIAHIFPLRRNVFDRYTPHIAPSLLCRYVRLLLEGSCVHTYSQNLSHSQRRFQPEILSYFLINLL